MIAKKNFLDIIIVDRELVGDEVYEELQLESLYARELGTKQMMKERDFDIILNSCKQRVEFQKCLIEFERQEQNQNAEDALSFEKSDEDNISEDEDPGLMESALSGISEFKLNTDEQMRSTFTSQSNHLLLGKSGHGSKEIKSSNKMN